VYIYILHPTIVFYPCIDQDVVFNGHAALTPGTVVSPWSYHPRKLEKDFVEISIKFSGICGSDLHTITGGWGGSTYPQIVGHEIVGEVTAVGPDVKTVKKGDRVGVGAQCWSCRESICDACPKQMENICRKRCSTYDSFYPDGQQTQGGYADRVRVSEHFAFKLPEKIHSEVAGYVYDITACNCILRN
jgi:alcohol dehydrogenase (NADP+)